MLVGAGQALAERRLTVPQYHAAQLKPAVDWAYSLPWLYYNDAPTIYTERDDVLTQVRGRVAQYSK